MRDQNGFTLIELMLVISIIGILAAIAVPQFNRYRSRSFLCEGYSLLGPVRKNVLDYFNHTGVLPENNFQSGLPEAHLIKGKYVRSITVEKGSITIQYNESAGEFHSGHIVFSPVVDLDNPTGTVTWEEKTSWK